MSCVSCFSCDGSDISDSRNRSNRKDISDDSDNKIVVSKKRFKKNVLHKRTTCAQKNCVAEKNYEANKLS